MDHHFITVFFSIPKTSFPKYSIILIVSKSVVCFYSQRWFWIFIVFCFNFTNLKKDKISFKSNYFSQMIMVTKTQYCRGSAKRRSVFSEKGYFKYSPSSNKNENFLKTVHNKTVWYECIPKSLCIIWFWRWLVIDSI